MKVASSLAAATALALATGCAGPVRQTGALTDYSQFNIKDDESFKLRLEPQDARLAIAAMDGDFREDYLDDHDILTPATTALDTETSRSALFLVDDVEWKAPFHFDDPEDEYDLRFVVRERLYRYLLRRYARPALVRFNIPPDDPLLADHRVVRFQAAITDIETGFAPTRYLIGYHLGATRMQLEGRILEGRDGARVLGEFAIRTAHGGYPIGYNNPKVLSAPYCLKYAADEAIDKFTAELPAVLPGAVPAAAIETARR